MTLKHIAGALAIASLALTGCTRNAETGGAGASKNSMTIKGSDTMVHLVTAWAEAYQKKHTDKQISVTGGGSGTGIAAMINGTTDVAMASRKMKDKEQKLAEKKGAKPMEHIVARDGIAVVLHPDNPIKELTMDQLRQIFNGTLENWSKVGGPDQKITVLSRESNSGTYVFFNKTVLEKDDFAATARLMPSSSAIIQSCTQDKWSIGYVGVGYTKNAKVTVVAVKKDKDAAGVKPSIPTVSDGSYPIARPLHLYTRGEPAGMAKQLLEFVFSVEGQKIVEAKGYIPLKTKSSTK